MPLGAQVLLLLPFCRPVIPASGHLVCLHAYCDRIDDAFSSRTLFSLKSI
jgi:hypothetical protein